MDDVNLLFWPGSLNARGFEAIIREAAAGAFAELAISPLMIHELLATGRTADDIIAEAAARGVRLSTLDGVSSWAPIWIQDNPLPAMRARFAFTAAQNLEMAAALGLDTILVAGAFDKGALDLEVLIDPFGRFCDEAARLGIRVELEFVPFWGIPELGVAWDIVRRAARPNSGLLIDTWHFHKGSRDIEADLALLATIPGDRLRNVQLADALARSEADTLYAQGRLRRHAGDGELAIDRIVGTIVQQGCLERIGPEIFGAVADDALPGETGRRGASTTRQVLGRAFNA